MKNQRKEMILNEILFWKKNNLLPEHYCNFLATLYAEGEELESTKLKVSSKNAVLAKERSNRTWLIALLGVGTIALLALLFMMSAKFVILPIIVVTIAIVGLLYYVFQFAANKTVIVTMAFAAAALLLLGLSVKITEVYLPFSNLAMHMALIINCVLWLVSGKRMKLIYFTISGAGGLLIVLLNIIFF
ncbi:hypothetical protein JFL43_00205 [Viridibacillus sp. YIM B01967]|uniref:DUF2157 domain-containing protein n=1 Tax=Viridibacillus soli TaxID=2798301 RepID=A0ABS1H1M1_9BACL|nr:hypothetical protein [Viridibacillus soli]MBK3493313.1 hypothetical protein [Viridibacillus soli]